MKVQKGGGGGSRNHFSMVTSDEVPLQFQEVFSLDENGKVDESKNQLGFFHGGREVDESTLTGEPQGEENIEIV